MQGSLELVFYGELVSGVTEEQAKTHVAALFKANVDQVERMFSGQRVVIRNKLDPDTAQKYVLAMRKRGAVCQIEEMGKPGVAVSPSSLAEPDQEPAPSPSPQASSAPAQAPQPSPKPAPEAPVQSRPKPVSGPEDGLPVAGERTDEVLANTHFSLDEAGVRLSEEKDVETPVFEHLDEISLAPVGADLSEDREETPVAVPDTSHLSIKPE